ncbi:hypothetical protein ACT3TE_17715 [Brachybacterium sp. AOP42-B2-9]|uniref:hypothetical protein n=1 Tax=Brachybacterium sp. AOP42-B2-9 TaxID=3457672 RepID=UPI0040346BFE
MRDVIAEVLPEHSVAVRAELAWRTSEILDQHLANHVVGLSLGAGEDIELNHHPMWAGRLRRIPQRRDRGVGHDQKLHSQSDRRKTHSTNAQVSQAVLFQRYAQELVEIEACW